MNNFEWIQYWFFANCDGSWEHDRGGISISTLENPGWSIDICLIDTEVEGKPFKTIDVARNDDDWIYAKVLLSEEGKNYKFNTACGPQNLDEAIGIFRTWVGEDLKFYPKDDNYWALKGGDPTKRDNPIPKADYVPLEGEALQRELKRAGELDRTKSGSKNK